jgi:hypothetical protein
MPAMPTLVTTRRQFTFVLASSLVACAAPPKGAAVAQVPQAQPGPPASAPAAQPAPAADPVAEALLALLAALHKDRLTADDLGQLRKPIQNLAEASAKLRAFSLPNSAEPHGGVIGNPGDVA